MDVAALEKAIEEQGQRVREAKASGQSKEAIGALVEQLKALKAQLPTDHVAALADSEASKDKKNKKKKKDKDEDKDKHDKADQPDRAQQDKPVAAAALGDGQAQQQDGKKKKKNKEKAQEKEKSDAPKPPAPSAPASGAPQQKQQKTQAKDGQAEVRELCDQCSRETFKADKHSGDVVIAYNLHGAARVVTYAHGTAALSMLDRHRLIGFSSFFTPAHSLFSFFPFSSRSLYPIPGRRRCHAN